MSDMLDRRPEETVNDYTNRMIELVQIIGSFVHSEADMMIDGDEVIASARWIVAHATDADRAECWQLQRAIGKIVDRMTSVGRLQRVNVYVTELAR